MYNQTGLERAISHKSCIHCESCYMNTRKKKSQKISKKCLQSKIQTTCFHTFKVYPKNPQIVPYSVATLICSYAETVRARKLKILQNDVLVKL